MQFKPAKLFYSCSMNTKNIPDGHKDTLSTPSDDFPVPKHYLPVKIIIVVILLMLGGVVGAVAMQMYQM